MGFFNKILVQDKKTGNLTDVTNLDKEHYESFLDAINKLRIAYYVAVERKGKETSTESEKFCNCRIPQPIEGFAFYTCATCKKRMH